MPYQTRYRLAFAAAMALLTSLWLWFRLSLGHVHVTRQTSVEGTARFSWRSKWVDRIVRAVHREAIGLEYSQRRDLAAERTWKSVQACLPKRWEKCLAPDANK